MSKSESTSIQPKSIRQKRILETAADNPDASLAEIAEEIPSASADHVDRVLDRYGDPASSDDSDAGGSQPESPNAPPASDEGLDSPDAPGDQSQAEQTDQPTPSPTDEGPDEASTTETPDITPAMDPDTDDEPTDSVAEPASGPSDESAETAGDGAAEASATDEPTPDPEDLTQKERETLRAIFYEPTATQDQIADMLSISRATVSNRVNAIPGFDWADRESFVDEVFDGQLTVDGSVGPVDDDAAAAQNAGKEAVTDGAPSASPDPAAGSGAPRKPRNSASDGVVDGPAPTPSESEAAAPAGATDGTAAASSDEIEAMSHQLEELAQRLATMEQELQDPGASVEGPPFGDADLLHKVVHACMNSDRITEDEELEILETLMV
jgi:DNA-binding CsgD family transcriptional regulator